MTRTKEGLSLIVHFSFQYQLQQENLPKLYRVAGLDYNDLIIRLARDVILKEACEFNATSYWLERNAVG